MPDRVLDLGNRHSGGGAGAAFQISIRPARRVRELAKYNLPIAVSSVIDLLTGLIRPGAFNFARE